MPHRPRVLDKISLFFQRLIWADLRQDRFGLSKRNLILVFGACQSVMSAFDSNRRSLVRYTYPNLAVLIRSNQSITDGYAANCAMLPSIVGNQKLSFDLDRRVL